MSFAFFLLDNADISNLKMEKNFENHCSIKKEKAVSSTEVEKRKLIVISIVTSCGRIVGLHLVEQRFRKTSTLSGSFL